ncbi:type IV pilin [Halococcoides cellulosivorans]|uniref:type IV pilin n=1 Tax=Halococcoides cellulosivorans TaxID=1679096 RepID=UPI0022779A1D|nr:polymer-forming cytoskeletal protein [Halococcoides cellulosivorans]
MARRRPNCRALSPVVGDVMLVAVVLVLGAVSAGALFGVAETGDPAPTVTLDLDPIEDRPTTRLRHTHGAVLDGDRLRLRGVADPDAATGRKIAAGDAITVAPVADRIVVVWSGDRDTSHVLSRLAVADPLPVPDRRCGFVDSETNGGVDAITVDGIVVACDVVTDEQVTVQNGGVVIGDAISDAKAFDGDDATVYGDLDVAAVANLQTGTITGDVTSQTADVKLDDATVEGAVNAEKVAEATGGTVVGGDVVSQTADAKVIDSTVEGSVTADDTVKLDGATVTGHVYADPADLDCTDSTIAGRDCGAYSPRPRSEW